MQLWINEHRSLVAIDSVEIDDDSLVLYRGYGNNKEEVSRLDFDTPDGACEAVDYISKRLSIALMEGKHGVVIDLIFKDSLDPDWVAEGEGIITVI